MTDDPKTTPYPEMMGDETEEQNLDQIGNPSARISAEDVNEAFGGRAADGLDGAKPDRLAALAEKLTESINAVRDQVQQSAETAKTWAADQTRIAKQAASEKPVLTASASAGAALALGLALGFIIGRATAED